MSNPQTFADLRTDVAGWLIRDDLEDMIPRYIGMAERRFNRTIFVPDRIGMATLTAADTITLPTDFWGVKTAYLDVDPKVILTPMPISVLRGAYAAAFTGQSRNYAISGRNMLLGPAPDSAYDVELTYWQSIPPLGDDTPDNWLLLAHPDLYVSGALTEAYIHLRDDQGAGLWESRTAAKIEEINKAGRHAEFGGPPQRIRAAVVV